jgi:hypothetical protein
MRPTDDARAALVSWSRTGDGAAKGIFRFPGDLPVFRGHFPGHPLVPGVYQLAAMAEVAACALGRTVEIRFVDRAKWSAPARPDQELTVEVEWYAIDEGYLIDGSLANESGNCATGRLRVVEPAPSGKTQAEDAEAADEGQDADDQTAEIAPELAPTPPPKMVAGVMGRENETVLAEIYTIEVHRHRFAAWVASRAASASKDCRFKVQMGVKILEACGIDAALSRPEQLPSPAEIDQVHRQYRKAIIKEAQLRGVPITTHGVAARLINCYLKARFVCAGHQEHERVKCLHPPIDTSLLKGLEQQNVGGFADQWREFHEKGWAKFDSETYQNAIDLMRKSLPPDQPLWRIEEYWSGHQ